VIEADKGARLHERSKCIEQIGKQPKGRVGIVGFSQNTNTVLALSGMPYSHYLGAPPFAAIVSFYPSCEMRGVTATLLSSLGLTPRRARWP
jgi:hypothetical protein